MGNSILRFPLATYGFRIGRDQIPGTPDIEALIHQDSGPLVIDPALQARSLEALRGSPSGLPMVGPHLLVGDSKNFTLPLSQKDLKLSPSDDSDPPDHKSGELSIIGPFRDQGFDRAGKMDLLKQAMRCPQNDPEVRGDLIADFVDMTTGGDVAQSVKVLLELVKEAEIIAPTLEHGLVHRIFKGYNFDPYEYLNRIIPNNIVLTHALSGILRLLRREELNDKRNIIKEILDLILSHPKKPVLVHVTEDWPVDDPHRVAPYLVDLDRPARLLLGQTLDVLTQGLELDAGSLEDEELQININQARLILQTNELEIRKYLSSYESKPYQPSRLDRFRRQPASALALGPVYGGILMALLWAGAGPLFLMGATGFFIMSSSRLLGGSKKQNLLNLATLLQNNGDLSLKGPDSLPDGRGGDSGKNQP